MQEPTTTTSVPPSSHPVADLDGDGVPELAIPVVIADWRTALWSELSLALAAAQAEKPDLAEVRMRLRTAVASVARNLPA